MMSALNDQLSSRLEQKPEDINYLMLLGRLAIEQGNYADAAATFGRLAAIAGDDPVVLAQYTQALFLAADRRLTPEAKAIAERALSIDPMQPTVLGLLGMNSYEQGDFVSAVAYWQRLLSIMNPASPQAQMIQQVLQQAQANLPEATASQTGESALISLTVEVSLAEGLQAPADAQVFVFARALQGPPMPLAVARLTVADLPAVIELNDSMAMMPSMKLSSFQQVELVARISSRGIADPTAGDIEGVQSPVDTRRSKPVTLQINQLLK
jgi:cytochrome c-type biogenesis protein CcmH